MSASVSRPESQQAGVCTRDKYWNHSSWFHLNLCILKNFSGAREDTCDYLPLYLFYQSKCKLQLMSKVLFFRDAAPQLGMGFKALFSICREARITLRDMHKDSFKF